MAATAKTVILDRPAHWDSWIFIVKAIAQGGDTWKYVNPELGTEPVIPSRPEKPTAAHINPAKSSTTSLTPAELDMYKVMLAEYREDLATVKQILDTLQTVRNHVVTTISVTNVVYIKNKSTVYQMLVALKKRLAPTDYARKLEVVHKYNKLKTFSKRENVEKWLKDWETTYADGKELDIPEVSGERSLMDFTTAISAIDPGYGSSQEYFLNRTIKKNEDLPELYELIEDFRNHQRKSEALKSTSSPHSAFATQGGETPDGESQVKDKDKEKKERLCLCGSKHNGRPRWEKCEYITPKCRPAGWKGKQETFDKINKELKTWDEGRVKWFIDLFKYDGLQDLKPTEDARKLGSYCTYSSYTSSSQEDYKLYNAWTLDNATDIHVCNDIQRSGFQKTRDASPDDKLFAGKTSYSIEAFGIVTVNVPTPSGLGEIELTNVALALGFMTNLVSLHLLNAKGVHWSSERPESLTCKRVILCNLQQIGHHWVLERSTAYKSFAVRRNTVPKSSAQQHATFTGAQMHRVLGHASPDVISHIEDAALDITIDIASPAPSTIDCETCSVSKATEVISRRTEVDEPENGIPFDRTIWDMVELTTGYNGDQYMSHFQCRQFLFNLVFTHRRKNDAFQYFNKAIKIIENRYNGKVRFVRLDGETSLGGIFENFVSEKGIKPERTAPDTPAQNGGSERSGRVIVTKGRTMRIEANLPANMWPETVKAAGYTANRTPVRKLLWKTPFEAVLKHKPRLAHMHVYGSRAYPLNHHIARKNKLEPRAHIGYLVGYDSTNIYRIWIPSRDKVIRTRDVRMNDNILYHPADLDIGAILQEEADHFIETLDIPETQVTELTDSEDLLDTHIVEAPELLEPKSESDYDASHDGLQTQLRTPSITPSIETPSSSSTSESTYMDAQEPPLATLPAAPGNRASRGNEISGDLNPQNIVEGSRTRTSSTRKAAYVIALGKNSELGGYHSSFVTAIKVGHNTKPLRLHRDALPPPPTSWKQMLKHKHSIEFRKAADKEFEALLRKGTFEYIEKSKVDSKAQAQVIPLMWTFTYKFNQDGYLLKHKARLVARGDLQYTAEDTYAATLAAQTFRAIMAVIAAKGLETRQYDAVNAFANSPLPTPILCHCAEGYGRFGYLLRVLMALYRLKTSPLLWYKHITRTLEDLGLHSVPDSNCLFVNDWLTLIFYVDDIITAYAPRDQPLMDKFEADLLNKYEMRRMGEAEHFLGVRIVRDRPQQKLWLI